MGENIMKNIALLPFLVLPFLLLMVGTAAWLTINIPSQEQERPAVNGMPEKNILHIFNNLWQVNHNLPYYFQLQPLKKKILAISGSTRSKSNNGTY